MGLFSVVGGFIGGAKAKKASKKAAKAQIAAMEKGIGEQRQMFDYTKGIFQPYLQGGEQAWNQYGGLMGLQGADAQQAAISQLQQSPFYTSLYRQGEEALLQNASATGGLRGGNTERGLADFGADTLATTIDRQLQGLGGMAQFGFNSANALGSFGSDTAGNVTNLMVNQGQAKAQDYMRRAAITSQNWNNLGGFLDQAASAVMGGIGAGGGMGAIGAGGTPFNMAAFGNSVLGQPGLFGGGGGGGGGGIQVTGLPNALPQGWGGI